MALFRETVNITLLVMDSTWSEQNVAANNHINSNSLFLCGPFLFIIYPSQARCVCWGQRRERGGGGNSSPVQCTICYLTFLFLQPKVWKEKQWLNLPLQNWITYFPEKMSLRPPNVERPEKWSQNPKQVMALIKDRLVPYWMTMIPSW